jgi:hypothetical protein
MLARVLHMTYGLAKPGSCGGGGPLQVDAPRGNAPRGSAPGKLARQRHCLLGPRVRRQQLDSLVGALIRPCALCCHRVWQAVHVDAWESFRRQASGQNVPRSAGRNEKGEQHQDRQDGMPVQQPRCLGYAPRLVAWL